MTRFEPGSVRSGRAVRGDHAPAMGYSRRGTGRSIDDVRGRGREALAATRGATALALPPTVEPTRRPARAAQPAHQPVRDEPVRENTTTYERIRTQPKRVETPEPRPRMTVVPPRPGWPP
jgi:hypothetical protein